MRSYVDRMAYGIFAERDYELARNTIGLYRIYTTKAEALKALETIQPTMWPWRVAPIWINNGGFVPNEDNHIS